LGVPHCLSRVGLYNKGVLQLPVSALTKEFKCAKVRLEITLVESRDKCVREAAPVLKTSRKMSAKKSVGKGCPSNWGYHGTGTAWKRGIWAWFSSS